MWRNFFSALATYLNRYQAGIISFTLSSFYRFGEDFPYVVGLPNIMAPASPQIALARQLLVAQKVPSLLTSCHCLSESFRGRTKNQLCQKIRNRIITTFQAVLLEEASHSKAERAFLFLAWRPTLPLSRQTPPQRGLRCEAAAESQFTPTHRGRSGKRARVRVARPHTQQ